MKKILFCGGGSAGHVVPNLAVMNELKYSHELLYMGTSGMEKNLVGAYSYPYLQVDCPKLTRSFTLKNLKIPFELRKAQKNALELLQKHRPDLVFSKGGFASYPAVWAADRLKIPIFTHESDLSPGLCTKMIAKKCVNVLTSFPETANLFENGKCVSSPLRKELFQGDKDRALRKYGFTPQKPVLLVLGGGSGSKAINDGVRKHLKTLLKRYHVLHLCGKGNEIPPVAGYVQREYEADMGSAYAASDYVICRAGSNTAFEAIALKKKTLFIPLEKCSRGDQLQNALYFQKKGLCHILRESELSQLPSALKALREDNELERNLKLCEIENGTPKIIELIQDCLRRQPFGSRE